MPRISLGQKQGTETSTNDQTPVGETSPVVDNMSTPAAAQEAPGEIASDQTVVEQNMPVLTPVDVELKGKSGDSVLSAFNAYPTGVFFSGEEEDETIIILLRAHIVTNVPWLLAVIVSALVPFIVVPILVAFNILPAVGIGTEIFVVLLWYTGVFSYGFINFLYWYFNIYLVTSERVVDIDWYSLLFQKVSSTQVSHIEDVTATRGGVFSGLFDYGNIQIQTAGTEEEFEFANIPHPQLVVKKIEELMQTEEKEFETNPTS